MSPFEAAQLLEVAPDATPEQIEARFHELRTKLEEKIGKAPTPGLKAKYRESLEEITRAFETLTLAADASALPVLQRQKAEDRGRAAEDGGAKAAATPAPLAPGRPASGRKSGSKEFVIVAIIAVALLSVGGWWVMKTKAENEEKARIAAVEKAEAERLAAEKQRAEAAEKARLAAEQERLDKLSAATRSRIAELRISWEALEQEARALERKTSDLKAEERSLVNNLKGGTSPDLLQTQAELAAHVELSDWLHQQLLRHPAKVARVQGEELLSAKQVDEAVTTIDRAAEEQLRLENEFAANRKAMLTLTTEVSIKPGIQGIKWTLTDAYGRTHTGEGALTARSLPFGPLRADFSRNSFKDRSQSVVLRRGQPLTLDPGFVPAKVTIESLPAGAEVWLGNSRLGATPLRDHNFSPGRFNLELRLTDYPRATLGFEVDEKGFHRERIILLRPDSGVPGFTYELTQGIGLVDGKLYTNLEVKSVVPGSPAARAGIKAGEWIYEIVPPTGPAIIVNEKEEWIDAFDVHAVLSGQPGDVFTVKVGGVWMAGEDPPPVREVSFALTSHREVSQPRPGEAFENTLGMKFVPVPGTKVLFSIWETRLQDFTAFFEATGYDATAGMWSLRRGVFAQHGDTWRQPGYRQEPNHPVVGMSHADALAFCRWLTEHERAAGRLGPNQSYRLPTDAEWSQAVGPDLYPWGNQWPPPQNAGNYPGNEARDADWPDWLSLPGYADKYARTSPVGSFPANRHGIFDLGGNAIERVGDLAEIVRGAGFNIGHDQASAASNKRVNAAGRGFSIGFRTVIAVE